ncbi:hypothetical protein PFUGPA_00667 [Plasmodium falciparum Palo Alto/Uganda]|uniref:Uncharacterized protein n=1 Tax=Plasmodium falciparum (isolate Palo Alto / Uganda) TaxID=57270 RepID=W4J6S7_PLAFP|nr:hypothetical protein PFUGPA_00667 [Plasmodium falciparum Palo Alto/Uganda]
MHISQKLKDAESNLCHFKENLHTFPLDHWDN